MLTALDIADITSELTVNANKGNFSNIKSFLGKTSEVNVNIPNVSRFHLQNRLFSCLLSY